ncbi:hypothetical protein DFJ73DRAFT_181576 [Zopfochytrium polystomum]|nr:hypothetical protein DFJ73DRAFT_181576 [Zopfochytrium polystomum]
MVHAGKHNIHSALDTVAKIETDLGNQATEVETLRRQNRVLQKERADFERRLYSERATWDRLKAEWAAEEHKLHEALKAQVIIAKAGRARSPSATAPISPTSAATFSFDPDESDQIKSLREEIKTKDEQISQLIHNAGENATSIQEITNRLTELLEEVEALRHESSDLLEQNRNLMEEAESYQILLQEKTVTGAFSTDMFLRGRAANAGGSFDMTQMPLGDELDVRSPREAEMKQQIHALTVYINKILSRIMVDERLAAVLVKSVDTDANAVPPTPTVTSPTSPGPNQASSAPSGAGDGSTAPLMDEGDEAYVPPPGFGSGSSHPPATAPGGGLFLGGFIRRLSNTLTSLMPGSSGPHAHPHPPADLATVSEEGAVASPTVTSPTEEKKESEDTATEKSKDESSSAAGPDVVEVQLA